jgi:hypothetical protein
MLSFTNLQIGFDSNLSPHRLFRVRVTALPTLDGPRCESSFIQSVKKAGLLGMHLSNCKAGATSSGLCALGGQIPL